MARIPVLARTLLAATILLVATALSTEALRAEEQARLAEVATDQPSPGLAAPASRPAQQPASQPALAQPPVPAPRWLDDVRAQRHALQEMRQARQDARKDEFLRRRQEIRDMLETERRLFRNHGPWLEPMAPSPLPPFLEHQDSGLAGRDDDNSHPHPLYPPPGWDNGWYYKGW
jgi:hypothetical protein